MESIYAQIHSMRMSAFEKACERGDLEAVRRLAPGVLPPPPGAFTPLMAAAFHGFAAGVEMLLPLSNARAALGMRPSNPFKLFQGETALIFAAWNGRPEAVKLLLPRSDPDARNSRGRSALMAAAATASAYQELAAGRIESARLLIPASDLSLADEDGECALSLAAANPHSAPIVEMLLARLDANAPLAGGRTALMIAAASGCGLCAEALLPASDLSAKDPDGRGARELAEIGGHFALAARIASADLARSCPAAPRGMPKRAL